MTTLLLIVAACSTAPVQEPLPPTDEIFQIAVDGVFREYQLYIPENAFAGAPLVVMLHGFTQTHIAFKELSAMDRVADQHGFVVVYPLGTQAFGQPHWNAGLELSQVDDVFFIETLVETLQDTYQLSDDVFVSGFSNGGFMAYTLMCETKGLIRAIAPVAALMSGNTYEDCENPDPISILHIHGTSDLVVPAFMPMIPFGGFGGGPVLLEMLSFIKERFSLPEWIETDYNERVRYLRSVHETSRIELYLIEDYGHFWPSNTSPERRVESLDASTIIWEFFETFIDDTP